MKSRHFTIFLIAAFALAFIFNYGKYNKSDSEKAEEDITTIKSGIREAMIELFDSAVNSKGVADCATLDIYELIKTDQTRLKIFRTDGLDKLPKSLRDSIQLTLFSCVKRNIIDSNYSVKLSDKQKLFFKSKIKSILTATSGVEAQDVDTLVNCVLLKVEGLTLGDYFSDDSLMENKLATPIRNCLKKVR